MFTNYRNNLFLPIVFQDIFCQYGTRKCTFIISGIFAAFVFIIFVNFFNGGTAETLFSYNCDTVFTFNVFVILERIRIELQPFSILMIVFYYLGIILYCFYVVPIYSPPKSIIIIVLPHHT